MIKKIIIILRTSFQLHKTVFSKKKIKIQAYYDISIFHNEQVRADLSSFTCKMNAVDNWRVARFSKQQILEYWNENETNFAPCMSE